MAVRGEPASVQVTAAREVELAEAKETMGALEAALARAHLRAQCKRAAGAYTRLRALVRMCARLRARVSAKQSRNDKQHKAT